MDSLICQTFAVSPAEPADFPLWVKLFFGIANEWNLSSSEACTLLELSGSSMIDQWCDALKTDQVILVSDSVLERLAYLAGVYKCLQQLFPEPNQWKSWIRKPSIGFGNRSALDCMLSGKMDDIKTVYQYLGSWQGEHYV